jgi:hypothetical protein
MEGFEEVDESVASMRVIQQHASKVDVQSQRKAAIFNYFAKRIVKLEVVADAGIRRRGSNPERSQSADQDNRTCPSQRKHSSHPFRQVPLTPGWWAAYPR